MSLSLYMDHHVHAGITQGLRRRGIDVLTAFEDGAAGWEDDQLLDRAKESGRVLFTEDDDLLVLAHDWLRVGRAFAGVVYARQLGITVGQAIRDLQLMAEVLDPRDMINRIEFIPLR